jgi:hypothetical protein
MWHPAASPNSIAEPMKPAHLLRLALVAGLLLIFNQTAGAIIETAQTLDRVTAEKVAQIESLGH